jgi:hypothetical protein
MPGLESSPTTSVAPTAPRPATSIRNFLPALLDGDGESNVLNTGRGKARYRTLCEGGVAIVEASDVMGACAPCSHAPAARRDGPQGRGYSREAEKSWRDLAPACALAGKYDPP